MKESVVRETAVSRIPKENIDRLKDDEKFIEFITNELTKQISERLIRALEESDEIIVKKPVLRVSEYQNDFPPYVEYRKTVDWEPLVRCKDCVHHKDVPKTTKVWCEKVDGLLPEDWFCADCERRDNE